MGEDIHHRCAESIARGRAMPRRDALLRGAWKNLRAGVTTVVHHDAWEDAFDDGFPLRVVRIASAHSLRFDRVVPVATEGEPFAIHLAEGVNVAAAEEVRELDAMGLVIADLFAVHAVGVDARGIQRLRTVGAAVVWCPSSNRFLFGRTAPAELLAPGIDVLLGSDSLLTADGSLLRRAARRARRGRSYPRTTVRRGGCDRGAPARSRAALARRRRASGRDRAPQAAARRDARTTSRS